MLFIVRKSTSACCWLFAFLSLGCAQDDLHYSRIEDVPISTFGSPYRTTTPTVERAHTRLQRRQISAIQDSCFVPPQPANGARRKHRYNCGDDEESCYIREGVEVPPARVLNYTCDSGYKLKGNPLVVCEGKGQWSPIPDCVPVKCEPLNTESMTAKCFRRGRWVSCDSSVLQGTRAKLSCRPRFFEVTSSEGMKSKIVECNIAGKWEPDPIECVPACGGLISETTGGFPWYASLYTTDQRDGEISFECGATVVRNNLVLTAASCVYDDKTNSTLNPEGLYVMAGHGFRDWDHPLHDPKFVQKSVVRAVHRNCDYRGENSAADIALVEIKEPFEFSSSILPACLDDYSSGKELLQLDAWGSISEFGATTIANRPTPNRILSVKTVPYTPYSQCKTSENIFESEMETLTSDKFCAGNHNRSQACIHTKGGGLVFKKNDSWYLMGIANRISDYWTFAAYQTCEKYVIYTNVSEYTAWIQNVIFDLDRYKSHPPCDPAGSSNSVTTVAPKPRNNRTLLNDEDPYCSAPPQPANGEWRSHQSLCPNEANCTILEGAPLKPGTQLIYTCKPGYKAKGSTDVYCGFSGNWSAIPVCTEIKCDSLNSVERKAICYNRFDELVDCDAPVPPGTRAEISCHLGYRTESAFATFRRETVKCSERGEWTPDPIRCVPVCGVAVTHQTPFIFNGTSAKISDFPWHATLYTQEHSSRGTRKKFICGATIIQTNFLVTAAHCVYNETSRTTIDSGKLFVMTGNILRDYDSPFHNPLSVRKSTVKNIYRPCKYYGLRGNYASDIALLELQTPFQFSSILLPACLDIEGYSDQILEPGVVGRVAGFGRTESGQSSGILQTLTLPYISYNDCKKSKNVDKNDVLISNDKFCAGYTSGSAVCEGDSGGGLVFRKSDSWYVLGIVSVGLGVDLDNGEKTCDRYSYSLYTKVSEYMTWIQDVMFQRAQNNLYSPCDADV